MYSQTEEQPGACSNYFLTTPFPCSLFSICRFREITGRYPEKITMVSFSFKQKRFETLHAAALRWPQGHFVYIGVEYVRTVVEGLLFGRSTYF